MKYEVAVEQFQSLQGRKADCGIIPGPVTRQIHILVGPQMMPDKLFATVYAHDGFSIEDVLAQYFKDNQQLLDPEQHFPLKAMVFLLAPDETYREILNEGNCFDPIAKLDFEFDEGEITRIHSNISERGTVVIRTTPPRTGESGYASALPPPSPSAHNPDGHSPKP